MLNFKDWEKTAEDGKTVTMAHPSGHTMKILVTKLPKIQQEAIKRLKLAKGGKVQKFDDGGDVSQSSDSSDNSQTPAPVAPAANITINAAPAPQNPAAIPAQIPPVQATPPVAPNFNPAPAPVPVSQNLGNPTNAALTQNTAANLSQQAGNEQQAVDTAKAQGSVPIAQAQQQNAIDTQNRINQSAIDMTKHADDFKNYMQNNKIDPNAFMDHKSEGGKAATALGVILGGIGGRGQNNFALDFLNKNIDRAVDAQKTNADNQKTVWGAYNQVYQNENAATELAKASMADRIAAQSNALTAQLGTPQAAINNKNVQAEMLNKRYDAIQKAAFLANQARGGVAPQGQQGVQSQAVQSPGSPASQNPETKGGNKTPAYGPDSADSDGVYNFEPMLKPDAAAKMDYEARRATGDPASAAQLSRLQEQYARASKADEILSKAHGLYSSLVNNATPGGWTGRLGVSSGLSEVPLVGGALSAVGQYAGEGITGARKLLGQNEGDEFSKNRDYDSARQELSDLLRSAYPGIGGGELNSKLNGVVPDEQDKPENVKQKMKAFEDLVKTGEFNLIKNKGLAN